MLQTLSAMSMMMFFIAGYALAADGGSGGGGLVSHLFLAFLGIITVIQLIPGLFLFGSMVKGLFARISREGAR